MRFLFTWLVNTVALGVAAWLVGDVSCSAGIGSFIAAIVGVRENGEVVG